MKFTLLNGAAVGLGLALAATPALAIDPATFTPDAFVTLGGTINFPDNTSKSSNAFGPVGVSTYYGNTLANASIASGPVVTTHVDAIGWNDTIPGYTDGSLSVTANGTLSYYFIVRGPSAISVPLIVTGAILMGYSTGDGPYGVNGSASAYGSVAAHSSTGSLFSFTSGETASAYCYAADHLNCNTGFTLHLNVNSGNEFGFIQMQSQAQVVGSYIGASAAYSTVDPLVQIDPAFASTHPGYSMVFADGLANQAAPVPEPPAAALLGGGLACIAGFTGLRRRRQRPAPHSWR